MYITEKDFQVRLEQNMDLVREAERYRLTKRCQKPKSGMARYGHALRHWVVTRVDKLRHAPPSMLEHS